MAKPGRPPQDRKVSCSDCRGRGKLNCHCKPGCKKHPAYPCPHCDGRGYKIIRGS